MNIKIAIAPMGAVRMTQRGKFVNTHAQRYLNYKKFIAWETKQHVKEPITDPVSIRLAFIYPIPVNWSGKKKSKALRNEILPGVKPDIDNVIKGVFDALNGVAWKDDNLVVDVSASKRYGNDPYIDITIEQVSA